MTDALAWALVHFVWQGAALGVLAWLLGRVLTSPQARYAVGVVTLSAMVVAFVWTFVALLPGDGVDAASATTSLIAPAQVGTAQPGSVLQGPSLPSSWLVVCWVIGVAMMSVRACGGWCVARRLVRLDVTPVSAQLSRTAALVAAQLGVRRVVRVFESSRVAAPVLIGWLSPVVLVPTTALTGLSAAQVAAVVAHEIAHVRRHDYIVNLCQTIVESALFFHPAVWWVSVRMRADRELCCDDLALSVSDRMTYATALQTLAQLNRPVMALAATDGSLVDRIRRIVAARESATRMGGWTAMLPLLLVISIAAPSASSYAPDPGQTTIPVIAQQRRPERPVEVERPVVVQTPRRTLREVPVEVEPEPWQSPRRSNQVQVARERRTEAEVSIERAELAAAERQLARVIALEERRLVTEAQREAVETEVARRRAAVTTLEQQQEVELRLKEAEVEAMSRRLGAAHPERMLAERELADMVAARRGLVVEADTLLRTGDVVTVQVTGEPALPTVRVADDGTVRLPFLAAIEAAGKTPGQLGQAIATALSSRGLMTAPTVTVSALRRQ